MEIKEIKERLIRDIEFLRSPEGFIRAGYPKFFRLFGRDSLIAGWQLLDYDSNIAKNTLKILSDFQGTKIDNEREEEPGKILHEWWGDISTKTPLVKPEIPWPFPYYGSVDSTFLYLILVSFYFQKTGDKEFVFSIKKNILNAVSWVLNYADQDKDALTDFARKNPRGIFFQGWRDSSSNKDERIQTPIELVEIQGYAFAAYNSLGDILNACDEAQTAERLRQMADELKSKFFKMFWWEEEKYFYFELDKFHQPQKIVTSNPGHLLFTGILSSFESACVRDRLFQDDMWTPYGIRTQSIASSGFEATDYQKGSIWPVDNWIIAQGLKARGFHDRYQLIKEALLKIYNDLGKIPELCSVGLDNKLITPKESNEMQAWSSAALLNMILKDYA